MKGGKETMSMKINGAYSHYKTNDMEDVKQQKEAEEIKKEQELEKVSNQKEVEKDEYRSSEKSVRKPTGLYHLEQKGDEKPKIVYDDPKKPEKKCITNTDRVDREIEKLKEKQKQLEQQIRSSSKDEKKTKELERKLAQVKAELSQKDNDTYRRQNASVSEQ